MFSKILIANRGEIALRIVRAARQLGIQTVAVHSTADAESLHVKFADESVCIGPPDPQKSYLNIPAIIAAAEISSAEAVHPGYGFLAENAAFAEICQLSGLRFIGPRPEHIALMGDKIQARKAMAAVGLPILPGCEDALASEGHALEVAQQIGCPVIIKAAHGGGGRGMKVVHSEIELPGAVRLAGEEAQRAFGNGALYIERFVERPRHIEFQVVGDGHGHVIHLGERECSVQRRHQKLVEEAPSPGLSEQKRVEMGRTITDALSQVKYEGVGTVELLMDEQGDMYFMEMNTRIQVEHPVTEMVTGIDLIRLQIEVSATGSLPLQQAEIGMTGHAIECRVNAEDSVRFAPSPGTITAYNVPGGPGVRIDSFVTQDSVVHPHYDSLVSKLIVHDVDRGMAIERMKGALREYVVEGIQTNIAFQERVMNWPAFRDGDYDTHIVEAMMASGSE